MKKLIVLGAGEIGQKVAKDILPNMLEEFEDVYFFDNDINKQGKKIQGYYILKYIEYSKMIKEECAIIIATDYWREIFEECRNYGVEEKVIALYDKYSFNNYGYVDCGDEFTGRNEKLFIQKQINDIMLRFKRIEKNISRLWDSEEEMVANVSCINCNGDIENKLSPLEMLENPVSIEEALKELERQAPKAYKIWRQLFENGKNVYIEDPSNNLSVEENKWADYFDAFGRLNWKNKGWLLDIGCGIQEFPCYLKEYPVDYIVGMDPLMPVKEHPFRFVQGIAEFIPYKDESFDYVTSVTSLDYVLLLDKALKEIYRVLKKDGKLLLWVAEVENAEEYNPYSEDVCAIDIYHMFHIHPSWFEPLMEKCLFVKESHYQDRWGNHFYAYRKG